MGPIEEPEHGICRIMPWGDSWEAEGKKQDNCQESPMKLGQGSSSDAQDSATTPTILAVANRTPRPTLPVPQTIDIGLTS